MRHDAGILAGLDILDLKVARVGDRVDPIDGQVPTGRHRRLGQQTEIADLAMDDVVARTQVVLVIGCSTSDLDT